MTKKYRFVIGLCPDEFGYIVPGYDYLTPKADIARGLVEAQDACKSKGVPDHYHDIEDETTPNSPLGNVKSISKSA
jgi:hypothetical protein